MNDRFKIRVPVFDEGKFLCFHFFDAINGADHYREIGPYAHGKEEQCTGLKDKNGRLIYEGDIIRLPWQAGWPDLIGVVKFNELYACFLLSKTITDRAEQSFWWNESKEVIGNIHENPELLEDK